MTITSTLFCYDLTTAFTYTPGLHISLCGHFCSHSPLPLTIGIITFPTNLHRQHISHLSILTSQHLSLHITDGYLVHTASIDLVSQHSEQIGSTMVCYLHSKRGQCTLLSSLTRRSTILVNVLLLNYGWIKSHYTLLSREALLHDFIILSLGYYSSFGLSWQQCIEELYRTGAAALS